MDFIFPRSYSHWKYVHRGYLVSANSTLWGLHCRRVARSVPLLRSRLNNPLCACLFEWKLVTDLLSLTLSSRVFSATVTSKLTRLSPFKEAPGEWSTGRSWSWRVTAPSWTRSASTLTPTWSAPRAWRKSSRSVKEYLCCVSGCPKGPFQRV